MLRRIPRNVQRHLAWLSNGEVRLGDGQILSWQGPDGYAYDESLCYLIKLLDYCAELAGDDRFLDAVGPSLEHLGRTFERNGGIGRNGEVYLFDSGIYLAALCAHARVSGQDLHGLMDPVIGTVLRMIETRSSLTTAGGPDLEDRWSRRFGPHLIKLVIPLLDAADLTGREGLAEAAGTLLHSLFEATFDDGLFHTEPGSGGCYTHGHCYATEGLLYAVERGLVSDDGALVQSAEKLASLQSESGGVANWWNRAGDVIEVADTTAQAVRIWQCVDRHCFGREIRQGLGFLKRLTRPDGGVRYHPASDHYNTWATVFAVQAMLWNDVEPDPRWLI